MSNSTSESDDESGIPIKIARTSIYGDVLTQHLYTGVGTVMLTQVIFNSIMQRN